MFNPFDRPIVNPRERPISSDFNELAADADRSLRDVLQFMLAGRTSIANDACTPKSGFVGCGFKVRPQFPIGMAVKVGAGLGFLYNASDVPSSIDGVAGLADLSAYKPVLLVSEAVLSVPAAPTPGTNRIDIVEVKYDRRRDNPTSRAVLNVGTGVFSPGSVLKNLATSLDGRIGTVYAPAQSAAGLSYKVGVAGATPSEPPVTSGYTKIATILVAGGVTTIDEDAIIDWRRMLYPGGSTRCGLRLKQDTGGAPAGILSELSAPPGVRVAVVGAPASFAQFSAYIFAGGFPELVAPVMAASRYPLSLWAGVTAVFSASSPVIMGTTLAATLNNAALTSPATKVAGAPTWAPTVGQPYIYFRGDLWHAVATPAAAATVVTVQFGLNG